MRASGQIVYVNKKGRAKDPVPSRLEAALSTHVQSGAIHTDKRPAQNQLALNLVEVASLIRHYLNLGPPNVLLPTKWRTVWAKAYEPHAVLFLPRREMPKRPRPPRDMGRNIPNIEKELLGHLMGRLNDMEGRPAIHDHIVELVGLLPPITFAELDLQECNMATRRARLRAFIHARWYLGNPRKRHRH